jgi:hypothetical protein
MQLGDDIRDSLADPRNFLKPSVRNEIVQRLCNRQEVLGRARVRPGTIGIAPTQCRSLAEFPE